MNFKYNFSILKNKPIFFKVNNGYIGGTLKFVKIKSDQFIFVFEEKQLGVNQEYFKHLKVNLVDDKVVFTKSVDNLINGLFGFTMFDTFGFPFELTDEMLKEFDLKLDMEGIDIFKHIQKMKI